MATKPKTVKEESVAAATLRPNPSRPEMLSLLTQMLAQLGQEDLSHFYDDAIAQIGHEADGIPPDAAARNAATIATKEDVDAVFAGEELSEETKSKALDVFNALVETKVVTIKAELEEEFEERLAGEAQEVIEQMTETLDQYLNYVASEWMKENEVPVEQSLRSEIAESLLEGLHTLFTENNIKVPEAQVDVVEALTARVEELQDKLDEETNRNIQLQTEMESRTRDDVFDEVAEGMVATQADKFKILAEGLEFVDATSFKKKLEIVKESHFNKKTASTPKALIEETEEVHDADTRVLEPQIARYADAITRTKKD